MCMNIPVESPQIHGPRVIGTTPNRPFLFRIPVTGTRPLSYHVESMPNGLHLHEADGIISGSIPQEGRFEVLISVKNNMGKTVRALTIIAGSHKLALTPPMGWNSWNVWAATISDQKVRDAADAMVNSGLADHGYSYINIDDGWEGKRCPKEKIQTNEHFPNMKVLADYIHAKGLKLGIYSSPGPKTCQGLEGSLNHEQIDAETYAEWGIDYLKYDWCSYEGVFKKPKIRWPHYFNQGHRFIHLSIPLPELKKPYVKMRAALDRVPRDIVYSIVPMTLKGKLNPAAWGSDVGANCWRTSGDICDSWPSISSIGFGHASMGANVSPGHWNDPDMLCVGVTGLAWGKEIRPSKLTQVEQKMHISLWCLLAAPLLIGCDLKKMDTFTLELLTNDELIDINQDPLGKAASRKIKNGPIEVWSRPLWDDTSAVGIFNRGKVDREYSLVWEEIGLKSGENIRDVWAHRELDKGNLLVQKIPAHGCSIFQVGTPKKTEITDL